MSSRAVSPVSHDEEDEWSEIYAEVKIHTDEDLQLYVPPSHRNLFKFKHNDILTEETTYYMTYGGGPEGGFFVKRFFSPLGLSTRVFAADRSWHRPFTFTELHGGRFVKTRRNGVPVCRFQPTA